MILSPIFSVEERLQWRLLARKSLPVCAGILLAVLLNLADMWYIAMLGAVPLEAISFTFPVMLGLSHALIGVGSGITTVIAQLEGKQADSSRTLSSAVVLPAVVTGVVTILACGAVIYYRTLFEALGARAEHIPYLHAYMPLWLGLCLPALALLTASNAALRGFGDTMTPAKCLAVAALLNGVLDPLFIFGADMGVLGAAIASVIAVWIAALLSCRALLRRTSLHHLLRPIAGVKDDIKRMCFIGFPATIAQMAPAAAQLNLTAQLAGFGADYVAGYGIGVRIETVFLVVFMGISASTTIFAARYDGAGDRASLKALRGALLKGCPLIGLILTGIVMLCAQPIAAASAPSDTILHTALLYLYNAPITLGFVGACMAAAAYLNGTMRPYSALWLYILRCVVFLVPTGLLLKHTYGAAGIYYALNAANIAAYIVAIWVIMHVSRVPNRQKA